MRDVADRAGVSIATVSFVVNNTKRVTPDTRARIEKAMQDLGFRRNLVARALASRRTRIIALVLAALDHGIWAAAWQGDPDADGGRAQVEFRTADGRHRTVSTDDIDWVAAEQRAAAR